MTTAESRAVRNELNHLRDEIERRTSSPWIAGTIVAVNEADNTVDIEVLVGDQTITYHGLPALGTYIPEAGHVAPIYIGGGSAPVVHPPTDVIVSTPPGVPTGLTVTPAIAALNISWTFLTDANTKWNRGYYEVQVDTVDTFNSGDLITQEVAADRVLIGKLTQGVTYYVRLRAINYTGVAGSWTSTVTGVPGAVTTGDIDFPVGAIESVDTLPTLPDTDYPVGTVVFLTTDGKLYRNYGDVWTAAVATTDLTGTVSSSQIADAAISLAKFASGLRPVQIVNSLPTLPDSNYPTDSTVVLSTDHKLYRNAAGTWTAAVPTSDLSGTITSAQITDAAITLGKFSSGLRPVQNVTSLPGLPNADYPVGAVVFLTTDGKLYRNYGGSWTAAVPTGDLSGTITETQIADNAITTGKIAANTITANDIASGTITSNEIAANTIQAGDIAAGTITSTEIAANTITAADIAAGTITATEIAANAIGTDELNADAVTADKIAANTITAAEIASGAITSDEIAANTIVAANMLVASFDNLVWNPSLEGNATGAPHSLLGSTVYSATGGRSGAHCLSIPDGTAITVVRLNGAAAAVPNGHIAATVGDQFYFECYVARAVAGTATDGIKVGVEFYNSAGTYISASMSSTVAPAGASYEVCSVLTTAAPAATAFAIPIVQRQAGANTGTMLVDDFYARRAMAGSLIVDGTITAGKIGADEITASQIHADAITATELASDAVTTDKILAGAITAAKIASGSISTEKLTVASLSDNAIANGSFEEAQAADATLAAKWSYDYETTGGAVTEGLSTSEKDSGAQSVSIARATTGGTAWASEVIPVTPGDIWYISDRVKASGASTNGHYLRVLFFNGTSFARGDAASYTDIVADGAFTTSWVQFSGQVTVPAGALYMRVAEYSWSSVSSGVTTYHDSVTARRGVIGAVIADGTITGSKIYSHTIDTEQITAGAITADELDANSVTAAKLASVAIEVGKYISSTTFTSGSEGWKIYADGSAEFNDGVFRGTVSTSTIIANSAVNDDTNLSPNPSVETAASNPTTELISNVGFETDTTGWVSYDANVSISRSTTAPRTGVGKLVIQRNNSTGNIEAGTLTGTNGIACSPGDGIAASGWVRANSTTRSCFLRVTFYDSNGTTTHTVDGLTEADSNSAWGVRRCNAMARPGDARFSISLRTYNADCVAGEQHFFDDASAMIILAGSWSGYKQFQPERSTAQAHTGSASIYGEDIIHRVPVVELASYSATFWLRGDASGDTQVGIYVDYYDADWNWIELPTSMTMEASVNTYAALTGTWIQHNYPFRTPATAAWAELHFSNTAIWPYYLDDLEVYRSTYVQGGYDRSDVIVSKTDVYDNVGLLVPTGVIMPWAADLGSGWGYLWQDAEGSEPEFLRTSFAPPGWLLCYGQDVSRSLYWRLFSQLGTAFGTGDGSTTFNIPDLRGRVPVGLDNMGGNDAGRLDVTNTLGGSGGEQKHQLTTGELAQHSHTNSSIWTNQSGGLQLVASSGYVLAGTPNTGNAGSNTAHNNMQPYVLINYIIKA